MRTNIRELLIEKYIQPSERKINLEGNHITEFWLDEHGRRHSILGQPSEVTYYYGKKTAQYWHKKDIPHRSKNLPASIYYDYDEKILISFWYKNGKLIREL